MRLWVMAAVVAAAALGAVAGHVSALPPIYDKGFIRECVRTHNVYRRNVEPAASNMRYMTWDAALARTARAWANKCIFDHNAYLNMRYHCHPHFMSVGENLWIGSYHIFHAKYAIKAWHDEVRNYNYSLQTCSKVCSHYTQVVWDDSYKLGCAVAFCKEVGGIRNAANFVCNYAPRGNFQRRPYKEGAPCSECARRDFCDRKLCRNEERDKIVYYSRWNPPWEFRIVCDEACIAIIISRALLIFVGFLAIYLFRKHFTNMFMST
ncbi:GLIPR1-like protein 1 [Phasianus colchicus]|uniref:GLIPR1-like protein 1 n=1 Tax=Phasianus colchicus TaxID=9054 RepID=UPI00129E9424|nr:GLIPR1-like protein 1 [Phasianus colchicus]